jgi:hypothetical protein
LGFFAAPVMLLASVASVFIRWRRAGDIEREQLKWLVYVAIIVAASLLGGLASASYFGEGSYVTFLALSSGIVGLTVGIPVAIGVAILRYRLYDIDRIINRTLVYGSLTMLLMLVYFGGVTATQTLFRYLTGQEQQPQLAVVVSTLAIAALFNPLRRGIQSFIDRRFYRSRYDARKTLEAFSTKLRDETNLQALNNTVVDVVKETMQPAHVSMWLRPDAGPEASNAAHIEQFGHK